MPIFVVGAHLKGLPLNAQLTELGAVLVREARTAAEYRFYAFQDGAIKKPGLVRIAEGSQDVGVSVPGEVWALPLGAWGTFLSYIPLPLGIGKIKLDDGSQVHGFLMEAAHIPECTDISDVGGWRRYTDN